MLCVKYLDYLYIGRWILEERICPQLKEIDEERFRTNSILASCTRTNTPNQDIYIYM